MMGQTRAGHSRADDHEVAGLEGAGVASEPPRSATRRVALGTAAAATAGFLAERALSPDAAKAAGEVTSVNGKTGEVVLTAENVGADSAGAATTAGHAAEAAALASTPSVKTANYTYELTDLGKTIECEKTSGEIELTIPKGVFAVGATLLFRQVGAAQVKLVAASGVTIHVPEGLEAKTKGLWSSGAIHQRAENQWVVMGDLLAQ